MYICLCKQVTDKQIEQAIEHGSNTLEAIQDKLGASTECGCCMESIQDIIAEHFVPLSNIPMINSAIQPLPNSV